MSPLPANAFSLGVNYPWLRYGQDFGTTDQGYSGVGLSDSTQCIAQDFARIRDCGATVVRWFLFADGRGGFAAEKGIPRSPDRFLLADVAAVLALAEEFRLKLCFSLIDY